MKLTTQKIKNIIIRGLSYGFASGFCVGLFPNKVLIEFKYKKYRSIPIPLISGLISSMGVMFFPLLMGNYFCDGVYVNKLIDKYDIYIVRFHQYDGKNNMYAFPSLLVLRIKYKI